MLHKKTPGAWKYRLREENSLQTFQNDKVGCIKMFPNE